MDSFRNYSSIISATAADPTKNDNERAVAETKNKNDEILKSLGEAKVFIASRSLASKVAGSLKAKGEGFVKNKLEEGYKSLSSKAEGLKQEINQKVSDFTGKQTEAKADARADADAPEDGTEGERGPTEAPETSNPAYDPDGAFPEDATKPPSTEESSNPGEQPVETVEEEATEATEEGGTETADAGLEAGLKSTTQLAAKGGGTAGAGGELEEGVTEGAELGGEEAAAGLLDAIPVLDVLGVIGGAVLAGIAGRKAKQQENKMANIRAPPRLNMSYQSGLE